MDKVRASAETARLYMARERVNCTHLLLHLDGTFTDSSVYNNSCTRGQYWHWQPSYKKWGSNASDTYASSSTCALPPTFNPRNFSVDWWFTYAGNGGALDLNFGNIRIKNETWGNGIVYINGANIGNLGAGQGAGCHYAFTSRNGTYMLYKNGAVFKTLTGDLPALSSSYSLSIAGSDGAYVFDELCVVSGYVRESTTFPVPTGPYTGMEFLL